MSGDERITRIPPPSPVRLGIVIFLTKIGQRSPHFAMSQPPFAIHFPAGGCFAMFLLRHSRPAGSENRQSTAVYPSYPGNAWPRQRATKSDLWKMGNLSARVGGLTKLYPQDQEQLFRNRMSSSCLSGVFLIRRQREIQHRKQTNDGRN